VTRRIGRNDDAAPGAGVHVDVRIHAHLADDPEPVEPRDETRRNGRSFAQQRQCLCILKPIDEDFHDLSVIVPDGHIMVGDLAEAIESSDGVLVIVEDRDIHSLAEPGIATVLSIRVFVPAH
jgi:hypothetical protein